MSDSDSSSNAGEENVSAENLMSALGSAMSNLAQWNHGLEVMNNKISQLQSLTEDVGGCMESMAAITTVMNARKQRVELWEAEELCDITLTAGDVSIKAHKIILASHSAYFRSMFCGNFPDAKKDTVNIIGKIAHFPNFSIKSLV